MQHEWHIIVKFSQKKQTNTALKLIAERQRYPASMADKQSSVPELNAALRQFLILYKPPQML